MKTKWTALVERIKQEARTVLRNNKSDGMVILTIHVIVDSDGEPMLWVVPHGRRVEPSRDARHILEQLTRSL